MQANRSFIHEYHLQDRIGTESLMMPSGARILKAEKTGNSVVLLAACNPAMPYENVDFHIIARVHPVPEEEVQFICSFDKGKYARFLFMNVNANVTTAPGV